MGRYKAILSQTTITVLGPGAAPTLHNVTIAQNNITIDIVPPTVVNSPLTVMSGMSVLPMQRNSGAHCPLSLAWKQRMDRDCGAK